MNHYKIVLSDIKYKLAGMNTQLDHSAFIRKIIDDHAAIRNFYKKANNYLLHETVYGNFNSYGFTSIINQINVNLPIDNANMIIAEIGEGFSKKLISALNIADINVTSKLDTNNVELIFNIETSKDLTDKSIKKIIDDLMKKVTADEFDCRLHFLRRPIELNDFIGDFIFDRDMAFSTRDEDVIDRFYREFRIPTISREFGNGNSIIKYTTYKFKQI